MELCQDISQCEAVCSDGESNGSSEQIVLDCSFGVGSASEKMFTNLFLDFDDIHVILLTDARSHVAKTIFTDGSNAALV